MLSRFHSLFVYVVVGLVVSAAANPMGQTGHSNAVLPKKSWRYDVGKRGSYDPYPEQKKPYSSYSKPDDKGKYGSYDDHKRSTGPCSVGTQQCCNQAISSKSEDLPTILGGLDLADLEAILDLIGDTEPDSLNGLISIGCSPGTTIDVDGL
ncbi:hypothetical protein BJV78DRAFT_1152819 [Lactifluus subvellereus]|nr:hypothetical protein BJV78DRAFT_1152819 [Lactifluus subvellereus]